METEPSQQKNDPEQQREPENQHMGTQDDTDADMLGPNEWPPLEPTYVGLSGNNIIAANIDTMKPSSHATSGTGPGDVEEDLLEWGESVSNAFDEAESVSQAERSLRQSVETELLAEQHRRQDAEKALFLEKQNREAAENLLQGERYQRRKAEEAVHQERHWREAAVFNFQHEEQRRKIAENLLHEERRLREAAEKELKEKSTETLEIQKRWKQAARELNKMRSQQQGFHVVTDDYLIERVNSLRYSIQTFAIQYYGNEPPKCQTRLEMHEYFVKLFDLVPNLRADLFSPERRADAIQAIVWWLLAGSVFDQFLWLRESVGCSANKLCSYLRPRWQGDESYTGSRVADIERKFQIWNASTTALLVELADKNPYGPGESFYAREKVEDSFVFRATWNFFKQIPASSDTRGLNEGLRQIFRDAIALDKEINRQVARIEWNFGIGRTPMKFDPQSMTATKEQGGSATTDEVRLVVAPRLVKRGKSTGDYFGIENQLLPMEVSLMPATKIGLGSISSTLKNLLSGE